MTNPKFTTEDAVQGAIDNIALEEIVEILRDPEWSAGMLEDIVMIVERTGREVANYPDGRPTWSRH